MQSQHQQEKQELKIKQEVNGEEDGHDSDSFSIISDLDDSNDQPLLPQAFSNSSGQLILEIPKQRINEISRTSILDNSEKMEITYELDKLKQQRQQNRRGGGASGRRNKEGTQGELIEDNEESKEQSNSQSNNSILSKRNRRKLSQSIDQLALEVEENMKRQKIDQTYLEAITPIKFDFSNIDPYKVLQTKSIQTEDSIEETSFSWFAAIIELFSQARHLKDYLSIDQGPQSSTILDILSKLKDISKTDPLQLQKERIKQLWDLKNQKDLFMLYNTVIKKLTFQNQQIQTHFCSKIRSTSVCVNCSHRVTLENEQSSIELPNELLMTEENKIMNNSNGSNALNATKLTVNIKVVYIYEYDQFKQYLILLRPGEYTFQDLFFKIKEKVQIERSQLKQFKKTFILVDLHENCVFKQMFNDERLKFNFKEGQTLTTFAYEISKNQKDKIKHYHFIHLGKDINQSITYNLFPRLIHFNDSDSMKSISMKIFRGLRNTLPQLMISIDPLFLQITENEAYSQMFCSGSNNQPYEMVLLFNDGQRSKLDPQSNKKLCTLIDPELIARFELIFTVNACFNDQRQQFLNEIEKQSHPPSKDQTQQQQIMQSYSQTNNKQLESCFTQLIKGSLIEGQLMNNACDKCKERKGVQQVLEFMKLGTYLALKRNKPQSQTQKQQCSISFPDTINLDKFMSKNSGFYQSNNDYQIVGVITQNKIIQFEQQNAQQCHIKDEETKDQPYLQKEMKEAEELQTWLKCMKDRCWVQIKFGSSPSLNIVQPIQEDQKGMICDPNIIFAFYKKVEQSSSYGGNQQFQQQQKKL